MTDDDRIKDKLLDAQRELIAALQGAKTKELVDTYQIIAETQYRLAESLMPVVLAMGEADDGPMTMQ